MFNKGSKIYGIVKGVCPKCHNESMYVNPNPYAVTQLCEMHEKCSHCATKYKIEPSFFYGSMYISYAVGIAFAVAAFVMSYLIFKSSLTVAFISIVAAMFVFYPIIIRTSHSERNKWKLNFRIE